MTVTWTVVFQQNGTHTLEVVASGKDSNGNPCSVSKTATVLVGEFPWSLAPLDMLLIGLITIGVVLTVVFVSVLKLRKRRPPPIPPIPPTADKLI